MDNSLKNDLPTTPKRAAILCVASVKGGVSKTTTSICVASRLATCRSATHGADGASATGSRLGLRVALIDADSQGAATAWCAAAPDARRLPIDVYSLASAGRSLSKQLEPLSVMYDVLVIDMPPGLLEAAPLSGLLVADLALTPMRFTPPDLRASLVDTVALVNEARKINPSLQHRFMCTMYRKTKVARDVMAVLESSGAPLLEHGLGDRTSFQLASAIGAVPATMGSAHRAAANEVELVVKEIYNLLFGEM